MNALARSIDADPDEQHGLPLTAACGRRLLFALSGTERPTISLERGRDIAQQLSMDLHVLQILADLTSIGPLFPCGHVIESNAAVKDVLAAVRATPAWLDRVFAGNFASERLVVRVGAFIEEVVQRAGELGASMIVIAPRKRRFGAMVTMLARASGIPVLVLREATSNRSILAATKLEDARLPVLRKATELGERLHAGVVAFHNLTPWSIDGRPGGLETGLRKLRSLPGLNLAAETVTQDRSPANAILQNACALDVDLIVVGARAVLRSDRIALNSIAVDVVNRARRSVLVVPLARPEGSVLRAKWGHA